MGQIFRTTEGPRREGLEVIGVTVDSKTLTPWERPRPVVYVPLPASLQTPATLLLRTRGDTLPAPASLEQSLQALSPGLSVRTMRPMERVVSEALWAPRLGASLLGGFALLGLVLATTGLYGILAFLVSRRSRELALHSALGASRRQIFSQVISEGLWSSLGGLGFGLLLAGLVTPVLRPVLLGSPGLDGPSFLLAGGVLATTLLVASTVPALRACRLPPAQVLRQE